jgi:hypothetical protein
MSRCRCIAVHIFGFVQAKPLGPWHLKEGSSCMQGKKILHSNSKTLYWQAFKGVCSYRLFPVTSKPQARKTVRLFRKYLHYGARYAPAAGGV